MSTILFVAEVSPVKPIMAAACVRGMNVASIRAAIATQHRQRQNEIHRSIMEKIGLEWPEEILSLDKIELFLYDLIVCFATKRTQAIFPALPGNPAVVYWNVPETQSAKDEKGQLRNYLSLQQHICGLVRDLFQQGYLNALVEARRNAELVMDNLHEGIIAHDINRKIFFFNQAAERITGYSRDEILGRDCHDVFPERFCKGNCSFCDIRAGIVLPDKPYSLVIRSK